MRVLSLNRGRDIESQNPKRIVYMSIISEKQHQANRQNAKQSAGPKTSEGKNAIRFNALTYGLRTRATILPDENAADYSRLYDELAADWQPQNRTERFYLETMVTSQWLLARARQLVQDVQREGPSDLPLKLPGTWMRWCEDPSTYTLAATAKRSKATRMKCRSALRPQSPKSKRISPDCRKSLPTTV